MTLRLNLPGTLGRKAREPSIRLAQGKTTATGRGETRQPVSRFLIISAQEQSTQFRKINSQRLAGSHFSMIVLAGSAQRQ